MPIALLLAAVVATAPLVQDSTRTPRTAADSAAAQSLSAVRVSAERASRTAYRVTRTRSSTRTLTPLREVPQAITVLGPQVLRDLGLQTMARAMEYVPGVTMGQGEGHRDAPTIRGQSTTADFFVDGVRDDAQYFRDSYNVSQIEALKGANALAFGRGGGGGVINRVMKQAEWTPTRGGRLQSGSYDERRFTLDVGQGLTSQVAARVNALHEKSGSYRDFVSNEKSGVSPTVALLAGKTMLRAGVEHFVDSRTVDRGIPSANGRPSALDWRTFVGDPDRSRSSMTVDGAHVVAEYDNTRGFTLRTHTRAMRYDKFYQNVFASSAVNAAGTQVNLGAYSTATDRRSLFNQSDLVYTSRHGGIRQTLMTGTEFSRQATENVRLTGYFDNTSTSRTVPLNATTVASPVTFRASATDADNDAVANVAAVFAQEQLHVGDHVQVVLGARYDRFAVRVRDHRTDAVTQRTDYLLSPRGGVVFTPSRTVSLYGSVGISSLPSAGDQFSSLSASASTLKPEQFRNREVGVKWTPTEALELNTALYRVDRTNSAAPDPSNAALLVQTGAQRTNGVEVGVTGAVTSRWNVVGGLAVQDARILNRTSAARAGASVPLVPRTTVSLWNKVRVSSRASLGAGVVHQGDRYAAVDNSVRLPAFTRVDGGLFVSLPLSLTMQANVENVLGTRYSATSHGNNNIMPGAPRTVRLSLFVMP
ncbi:TonB-dependent receptor [Gemmatimonas groenlandica]|uniref:TonB-dependent siderophore receptor n=1 Tax=Gemmatimonas groenlandica TaxID=2732249 RepID=A0A6M4IUU5_9BACT|nr:TonB-dependent siderophore receptor [Gemmatimonas groenlandica]QJR37938.1 TonB-dependent siderophore receptor [Gemmatimonas groenlandica]